MPTRSSSSSVATALPSVSGANRARRLLAAGSAAALWLIAIGMPRVAMACSVCGAGRDEQNQTAFLVSTVFMSVLPLAALGTLVGVVWRRLRKLEEETQRQVEAGIQPSIGA